MARLRWFFVFALAAFMALAPALAEARAGGGRGSMGSRGARTYQSNQAQPMQRSVQPPAGPTQSQARPAPVTGTPLGQPGFVQRHPFLTGLMGGFLGAGLFGMLFGHSAWAADGSAFGSSMGFLLQILVIAGLAWLAFRIWRSRSPGGPGARPTAQGYEPAYAGAVPASRAADPVEIAIAPADYDAWGALLGSVQDAWSRGDLSALRRFVTPEMLGYFSDELSALASRGLENRVEQVELLKGDVEEAWSEGEMEYATARLRWRALDYTTRLGTGEVVEGSRSAPGEASEVWTFVRARGGGSWLLSAIQQV
jgi:predicted lipid-binding transport protein (Tim44 family)